MFESLSLANLDRRMRALERRYRASNDTGIGQILRQAGDTVAETFGKLADRFGDGAEARRFGLEAARMGDQAMRRVVKEAERRPLAILAVAIGIGILWAATRPKGH